MNLTVKNNPCSGHYYVDFTLLGVACTTMFNTPQQVLDWAEQLGVTSISWDICQVNDIDCCGCCIDSIGVSCVPVDECGYLID